MTPPKDKPITILDQALQAAATDPNQANLFYDAFLNSPLFLPVQQEGKEHGAWEQLKPQDKFFPLFLTFENGKAVTVFDDLRRMQLWASERPLDYLLLKGHLLIKLLDKKVFILLNPGSPWNYTLTPDILAELRRAMKPIRPT